MGISVTQSKQRSLSLNDLKMNSDSVEAKQLIQSLINKYSKRPKALSIQYPSDQYVPNFKDFK